LFICYSRVLGNRIYDDKILSESVVSVFTFILFLFFYIYNL